MQENQLVPVGNDGFDVGLCHDRPIPDYTINNFLGNLIRQINSKNRAIKVKCSYFSNDRNEVAVGLVGFKNGQLMWNGIGKGDNFETWPVQGTDYTGFELEIEENSWLSIRDLANAGVVGINQTASAALQIMDQRNAAHYQQYETAQTEIRDERNRLASETATERANMDNARGQWEMHRNEQQTQLNSQRDELVNLQAQQQAQAHQIAHERAELERMRAEVESYQ
eukprot:PhF_6_TR5434/c0_g1_i1/m.7723